MENETKTNKTSRASQTREKTSRPKVWTPPSSLDAPPAPTGYRHRSVSYTHLRAHETRGNLVCRLLL